MSLTLVIYAWMHLVVVRVENQSMLPTLKPGDKVLVLRNWPTRWLRKGDVVLVWPWHSHMSPRTLFGVETPFIKRLVGMPGDNLITSLDELDGYNRARELLAHNEHGERYWHIPPGHCFVRGDNRPGGFDSLSWGPVSFDCILGRVLVKLPFLRPRGRV